MRSAANSIERDVRKRMKRLRILRRWFKRRFGYARLMCLALLIGLAALRLADAMRRSRVVLGETGLHQVQSEFDKSLPLTGLAMLGEEPQPFMLEWPGLLRNVPLLEAAAAGRGLFTIKPERDGIVRRVPVMMLAQGATMPSLSFEMLRVATGTDTIFIKSDQAGIKSIGVKGFQIPTDRNGQLWVHFAHHDPRILVSALDVIEGKVAPEKIKGQLVLIGTSAVGLND